MLLLCENPWCRQLKHFPFLSTNLSTGIVVPPAGQLGKRGTVVKMAIKSSEIKLLHLLAVMLVTLTMLFGVLQLGAFKISGTSLGSHSERVYAASRYVTS